jgi:hypothetical protein
MGYRFGGLGCFQCEGKYEKFKKTLRLIAITGNNEKFAQVFMLNNAIKVGLHKIFNLKIIT